MLSVEGLENKPFVWGSDDCFGTVRAVYYLNFGIKLRNWARPNDWFSDSHDLISQAYVKEGFEQLTHWKVGDLREGDIMCMCVGESNPNHMGVYLGDNQFIHHLYGHFSRVVPLEHRWLHYTAYLLRHPDVPDLRAALPDVTIEELLRARHEL